MTFWQAYKSTYGEASAFLLACPSLALIPAVFEILQHVAEMQIGMYVSIDAAKALENHPLRMAFGMVKILGLILPIYWVTRYIGFGRDALAARRIDEHAAELFGGYLLFQMALAGLELFVIPKTGYWLLATFIGGEIIAVLLAAWGAAAPLGNRAIGPLASAKIMARHIPWTIAFFIAAMLPLMIPHYLLGAAAIFSPTWSKWPILIADAFLVSWLAAVLAASGYFAARRAAEQAGVNLLPQPAV